jgi:Tfp pilus assembly protein PilN
VSWIGPNLARRPFLNLRPVHRTAAALTVAALLLTAWNVFSFEREGSGAAARAAAIAALERESGAARERLATIEADLARRDLDAENRRAAFLNARIEERTFSWNQLFDRLAEALPPEVRVRSLSPRVAGERRGRTASVRTPVELRIVGEAEDDEALLAFVDRLFAHPSFARPNLQNESRQNVGSLAFTLSVTFYPEPPAVPEPEAGGADAEDPAVLGGGESS